MSNDRRPTGLQQVVKADAKAMPVTIGILILIATGVIGLVSLIRDLSRDVRNVAGAEVRGHDRDAESHQFLQRKLDGIRLDVRGISEQQTEIRQEQKTMLEILKRGRRVR